MAQTAVNHPRRDVEVVVLAADRQLITVSRTDGELRLAFDSPSVLLDGHAVDDLVHALLEAVNA